MPDIPLLGGTKGLNSQTTMLKGAAQTVHDHSEGGGASVRMGRGSVLLLPHPDAARTVQVAGSLTSYVILSSLGGDRRAQFYSCHILMQHRQSRLQESLVV